MFTLDELKQKVGEREWGWYDYTPILELYGEIIVKCDQQGYQGDTLSVVKKDGKYGYINFGWGSCSGCDALQACENISDVYTLAKGMYESIRWFDSSDQLLEFINTHDYDGDWTDKELVTEFKKLINESLS